MGTASGVFRRLAIAALVLSSAASAEPLEPPSTGSAIVPFSIRHAFPGIETNETPISLSRLNPEPAGARGFLAASQGHLSLAGKRIRLYGINMASGAFMPSKEQGPVIAARLRKEGFNAVRLFGFDRLLAASNAFAITYKQQGILNVDHAFNPVALDHLDAFAAELIRCGLFLTVPLHASRRYLEAPEAEGAGEGVDQYLEDLIASQEAWARAFLGHVNPYTGRAWGKEPGLCFLEVNNENALSHFWSGGKLDRCFSDASLFPRYGRPLAARWQAWLERKYTNEIAAARAWGTAPRALRETPFPLRAGFSALPKAQRRDLLEFLAETEGAYFARMVRFLKETLGVSSLVLGTQQNYTQPQVRYGADLCDLHSYYGDLGNNTGLVNRPGNGRPVFEVQNRSAFSWPDLKDAGHFGHFELKNPRTPNLLTEYAYRDGNQYAAEMEPLLTAWAGFQDLDAVFMFNYHGMNLNTNPQSYPGWYQMTATAATRVASALAFRRGDLTPGPREILHATPGTLLETQAERCQIGFGAHAAGGNVRASYEKNLYLDLVSNRADETPPPSTFSKDGVARASSGEIIWRPLVGLSVKAPRVRTAIGFFSETNVDLGDGITVVIGRTRLPFAVVNLISLDDASPLPSRRMLLTLAGSFTVPGEYPREPGSRRWSWGDDAAQLEGIAACVCLPMRHPARVFALDSCGARQAEVPTRRGAATTYFEVGPRFATAWYLVEDETAPP